MQLALRRPPPRGAGELRSALESLQSWPRPDKASTAVWSGLARRCLRSCAAEAAQVPCSLCGGLGSIMRRGRPKPHTLALLSPHRPGQRRHRGVVLARASAAPRSIAVSCRSSSPEEDSGGGVTSIPEIQPPDVTVTGNTRPALRRGAVSIPLPQTEACACKTAQTPRSFWRAIATQANLDGKGPIGIPPQRRVGAPIERSPKRALSGCGNLRFAHILPKEELRWAETSPPTSTASVSSYGFCLGRSRAADFKVLLHRRIRCTHHRGRWARARYSHGLLISL